MQVPLRIHVSGNCHEQHEMTGLVYTLAAIQLYTHILQQVDYEVKECIRSISLDGGGL